MEQFVKSDYLDFFNPYMSEYQSTLFVDIKTCGSRLKKQFSSKVEI